MHLLTLTRLMGDRQYPHSLQVTPTLPMGEKLLLLALTSAINRGREPTRCATNRGRRLESLMGRFHKPHSRAIVSPKSKMVGAIRKTITTARLALAMKRSMLSLTETHLSLCRL